MTIDKSLLKKLFGKEESIIPIIDKYYPTMSPSVNYALQGGLVPGRFYTFFGGESAGKTMFAVSCCAQMLKDDPDGIIIWFDAEKSFSRHWLNIFMSEADGFTEADRNLRFRVEPVDFGREIFDFFAEKVTDAHDKGLKVLGCVVDSLHGLIPPKESNKDHTEKMVMGDLASYLPGALRLIVTPSRKRNITWVFLSQSRIQFDPIQQRLGNKFKLTGGQALLHCSDAILHFEKKEGKKNKVFDTELKGVDGNEAQIGHYIKMKVLEKSRVGIPNRVAIFKFLYSEGIVDTWEEISALALGTGVVKLEGKTYFYNEEKIGVGMAEFSQKVKENEQLQQELYIKIMETDNAIFSNR